MTDDSLPPELLGRVTWSFFSGEVFADPAEFSERVRRYNAEIGHEEEWKPDEVVLHVPRVRITYFGVETPDDEEYSDRSVELASDNGAHFTAGELLFKLNNAVAPHLETVDHCYFEGLELSAPSAGGEPPVYRMDQGS